MKDLLPAKILQNSQKSVKSPNSQKDKKKCQIILRTPNRKDMSDPVVKNIKIFDNSCNNDTTNPLELKKKNDFVKGHPYKHKSNSLVTLSPEFEPAQKKRLSAYGGEILTESNKKVNFLSERIKKNYFALKEQRVIPKLNDFSNLFEEVGDDYEQYLCINKYKRRMRGYTYLLYRNTNFQFNNSLNNSILFMYHV